MQNTQNSPFVITSNSRVKVYKPYEDAAPQVQTTIAPPTTTTTAPPTPQNPQNIQPIQENRHRRPLVFNKRDPNGESRVSQPFEYFNRLTQFFSNRIRTPSGGRPQRFQGPPPPRLQRQRLPSLPTT